MNEDEKIWYGLHFLEREILRYLYLKSGSITERVAINPYGDDSIVMWLNSLHLKGYVVAVRTEPVARLTTAGRELVEKVFAEEPPASIKRRIG